MRLSEITKFKRKTVDQSLPWDSATNQEWLIDYHQTRDDKLIGPHEGRYLALMKKGLKPAVLLDPDEVDVWGFTPYLEDGTFSAGEIRVRNKHRSVVVTQPGQEWRIQRLANLYKNSDEYFRRGKEKLWHARIGMLLGYSNEEIRAFINK